MSSVEQQHSTEADYQQAVVQLQSLGSCGGCINIMYVMVEHSLLIEKYSYCQHLLFLQTTKPKNSNQALSL